MTLPAPNKSWTFLTNHAHVLICLLRDPEIRMTDLAKAVGVTERAISRILRDLEVEGAVQRHKQGRRNRYDVDPKFPLRHPLDQGHTVGELFSKLVR